MCEGNKSTGPATSSPLSRLTTNFGIPIGSVKSHVSHWTAVPSPIPVPIYSSFSGPSFEPDANQSISINRSLKQWVLGRRYGRLFQTLIRPLQIRRSVWRRITRSSCSPTKRNISTTQRNQHRFTLSKWQIFIRDSLWHKLNICSQNRNSTRFNRFLVSVRLPLNHRMLAMKKIVTRDRAIAAAVDQARAERGTSFGHISYWLFVLLTRMLIRTERAMLWTTTWALTCRSTLANLSFYKWDM